MVSSQAACRGSCKHATRGTDSRSYQCKPGLYATRTEQRTRTLTCDARTHAILCVFHVSVCRYCQSTAAHVDREAASDPRASALQPCEHNQLTHRLSQARAQAYNVNHLCDLCTGTYSALLMMLACTRWLPYQQVASKLCCHLIVPSFTPITATRHRSQPELLQQRSWRVNKRYVWLQLNVEQIQPPVRVDSCVCRAVCAVLQW